MTYWLVFWVLTAVLLTSWSLTGLFRRFALARRLLDFPNARSSHVAPAPRGGGIAIVFTVLVAVAILGAIGAMHWQIVWGLLGSGVLVAALGFADDLSRVRARWRLLGHVVAGVWLLAWLDGLPSIFLFGHSFDLGWAGNVLALLYIVWVLNLTNFMDGIDGIAAVEAITVSIAGVLFYLFAISETEDWLGALVLAAATLGFLLWNWPPAKIFMGDAGSGFLGLALAALSLQAAWVSPVLLWSWIIMLGVFAVDATVTLLRRVMRGEKFYEAHRSHAYQHAAHQRRAHLPVTVTVAAINLLWLLPIALLVAAGLVDGLLGTIIAYAPLVAAAFWLKAGDLPKD